MSKIDEIMKQADDYADAERALASLLADECDQLRRNMLRLLLEGAIAAALADARCEGAEAIREAAGDAAQRAAGRGLSASAVHLCIRALPLPTGPRQAVLLTDEQIDGLIGRHWGDTGVAVQSVADFAARVQAAVIAANNLEVRRG